MTEKKALIIGCGIAGPALAMYLQRVGITPIIYEAQPEPRDEAGFFLNLAPNGLSVLTALGVEDQVVEHGTPTTAIVFQNHQAKRLGLLPATTLLIKRGVLNKVLREEAVRCGVQVEFGKRLQAIETTSHNSVVARFVDSSEAHGDLLIGCDGLHSRTRRLILPDAPKPRYSGLIDSGGFAHAPGVPPSNGVFTMTFGTKGFFGYQALPSGEVYWFENFHEPAEPSRQELEAISNHAWQDKLLELHRHDHGPIGHIIRSTDRIGCWPNYDLPPLPTWHSGPVCLIGDAAHAMLPSAGQGASMALEDAAVLAKCLRDFPDTERAFVTFEALRRDRVEALSKEARRNGSRKAPTNAFTRSVRDLVLPFFLKLGVKNAQRAYAYNVRWDEKVV